MNWNIFLAVMIALLTAVVSGLGGHLAATKVWHKLIFWGVGVVIVLLIYVQASINEHSQQELVGRLSKIEQNTEKPPQVTVTVPTPSQQPIVVLDPEIRKMFERQERELTALKSQNPTPKQKTQQLSDDIIKFSSDMIKNEPIVPISGAATREEFAARQEQMEEAYRRWSNQLNGDFQNLFARRIAYLADDVRALHLGGNPPGGLPDEAFLHCVNMIGNIRTIENCGVALGTLAAKLP